MKKRLHLPDCDSLSPELGLHSCDCGKPPGILDTNKTLVHRYKRGKVRMVVVPKSQVREDEVDLAVSRLSFEVDASAFVARQLKKDDRAARRRDARRTGDVWTT